MGKEMKNIIVLKNMYSNFFDEVIFVLKKDSNIKNANQNPNIIYEARKVVEDFINRSRGGYEHQVVQEVQPKIDGFERGRNINLILNVSLALSAVIFVLLLIKVW